MRKISYNIDTIFYETMMFLLIETLTNVKSKITGDVRVFFRSNENSKEEISSFIVGEDYPFKRLSFYDTYFSLKLANRNGRFKKHKFYYKSIVGFCSDVIYIMYLDHQYDYNYKNVHTVLPSKLNTLFNYQIRKNLTDVDQSQNKKNKVIRITFFEHFPGVKIPKHFINGDQLLVLVLENTEWSLFTDDNGIYIKLKDNHSNIFLPYNSIVTYFNDGDSLFLNRNVKVMEEDFAQDYYYTCDGNLIYVNFDELLEENADDIYSLFTDQGTVHLSYIYPNNKVLENKDNLIVGDFQNKNDDSQNE